MQILLLLARFGRSLIFGLIAFAVPALPALCEEGQDNWEGSVGTWVNSGPSFSGSDESELIWRPIIDVVWNDQLFFSTRRGIGYWFEPYESYGATRLGFSIAPSFDDLDLEDDEQLAGLRSIGEGLEARAFLEWSNSNLDLAVMAAQELSGEGHGGRRIEFSGSYELALTRHVSTSFGPFFVWGDETYARALYGVDPSESGLTGLPIFEPSNGWERAGAVLEISLNANDHAAISVEWELSDLLGGFGASPIVQSKSQSEITIVSTLRF